MKRLITLVALIASVLSGFYLFSNSAVALSGSSFQAGRIIDDGVFFNPTPMTVSEIQAFLNAKVPVCDTWHAGSGSNQPPFTCLKDYSQNIPSRAADSLCSGAVTGGTKSAAQIIKDVAVACSINPQVILITLQKEQSLITDDWPWTVQYTKATGYGCPDSALGTNVDANQNGCYDEFEGFFNQIYYGARQFQRYAKESWRFNYRAGETPFIAYNPDGGCGGTNVYIQNQATAGLYNYTPYQPNSAALSDLYGSGDIANPAPPNCSAFGNRNFWRMYNDWFGSVYAEAYNYDFVDSSSSLLTMEPGFKRVGHYIKIRNTGHQTWYADGSVPAGKHAMRLAMRGYENSPFTDTSDPAWLGTRNQIKMTPATVAPGEVATFVFNVAGPNHLYPSPVSQNFVPVLDGSGFFRDINLAWRFTNRPGDYAYNSGQNIPSTLYPNQRLTTTIRLTNTGLATWYADGSVPTGGRAVRLAMRGYENSPFTDTSDPAWLGTRNQIKMTPATVAPGEVATFVFNLTGPLTAATRDMYFIPVLDGLGFMKDIRLFSTVTVPSPSATYSFVSATNPPPSMAAGSTADVSVTLKNTGTVVWTNESSGIPRIRLMMTQPNYRSSAFYDSSSGSGWIAPSQITYTGSQIGLNGTLTFNFKWKAPATPGTYTERFAPVLDGYQLMPDIGMGFVVTVTP